MIDIELFDEVANDLERTKDVTSDASRKLETVVAIMTEMELSGRPTVSTELVRALLQPAVRALGEIADKTGEETECIK